MTSLLARIAVAFGLASFVLMAALHALRPDLNPAWHVLSEYAVGKFGFLMALCFLCAGIAAASLIEPLLPYARGRAGRAGLIFLGLASLGLLMAAVFPMDPITTSPDSATFSGTMHEIAGTIGVPAQVLAAIFITLTLRKNAVWWNVRAGLLALTHLTWIGVLLTFVFVAVLMQRHALGGWWMVGWANRLFMAAFCGWVIVAACPLMASARAKVAAV